MEELERATKRLKSARDELDAKLQKIDSEEKRLKDRMKQLYEKKTECAAVNGDVDVSDDDLIEINAGGKIIAARRGVLCQLKGTRFEALFSGRWEQKLQRDGSGRIFLDVNGDCFQAIVDWLNMRAISSDDESLQPPTVDKENVGILRHQMELFEMNAQFQLPDSNIIKSNIDATTLHNWLSEEGCGGNFELLYRSSRDGIENATFHSKCDNKSRTIAIIQTTEGHVLGGYTSTPWGNNTGVRVYDCSGSSWRPSKGSFLFSLSVSGISSSAKMKLVDAECKYVIGHYHHVTIGLRFGRRGDLTSEFYTDNGSVYINIEETYERAPFEELNGYHTYEIKEMEVFQVSDEVRVPTRQKSRSPDASEEGEERNSSPVEISDAIDSKWTALKDLDAEIISLENSFTDEEKFISSFVGCSASGIVALNVSGTVMATKRETLLVIGESMLAQQFDDTKWTEQGCENMRVSEWTPEEVAKWAKKISNIQEDVSNLFQENDINGAELLALNEFGLEKIGVKRAGTICLLLKEIKQLEKASQDVVTLIEHSPYCFGKILDFLRMKQVSSLELCGDPALPSVCEHKRDMFEKVVKYYFPGESSKRILG
eukprot:scaffold1269_cov72-Skeletonema_dohrnii-CCMP3373.AAC.1